MLQLIIMLRLLYLLALICMPFTSFRLSYSRQAVHYITVNLAILHLITFHYCGLKMLNLPPECQYSDYVLLDCFDLIFFFIILCMLLCNTPLTNSHAGNLVLFPCTRKLGNKLRFHSKIYYQNRRKAMNKEELLLHWRVVSFASCLTCSRRGVYFPEGSL